MALTSDFLIYGTDVSRYQIELEMLIAANLICWFKAGHLQYFFFEDWKYINEYRHVTGIRSVHPEPSGSRLILVDEKLDGFIYNPVNSINEIQHYTIPDRSFVEVNDSLVEIPNSTSSIKGVLWDNSTSDKVLLVLWLISRQDNDA